MLYQEQVREIVSVLTGLKERLDFISHLTLPEAEILSGLKTICNHAIDAVNAFENTSEKNSDPNAGIILLQTRVISSLELVLAQITNNKPITKLDIVELSADVYVAIDSFLKFVQQSV